MTLPVRRERPTHDCPIEGCQIPVPSHQLLCRSHWALVPGDLGRAVYATWKRGRGAGSDAHEAACRAAIAAVQAQLRERAT